MGYVGSLWLTYLRISMLLEREVALMAELRRRQAAHAGPEADEKLKPLEFEIAAVKAVRTMRLLNLMQDLAGGGGGGVGVWGCRWFGVRERVGAEEQGSWGAGRQQWGGQAVCLGQRHIQTNFIQISCHIYPNFIFIIHASSRAPPFSSALPTAISNAH